jgi:hypothetical protein
MTRVALTAEQVAALAAGATLATTTPVASAAATTPGVGEGGAVAAPVAAPAVEATSAAAPAAADAVVAAPAAAVAAPAAVATGGNDVLAFVQSQLATKDAMLVSANVEITTLKSKVTDLEAASGGLLEIAMASANNMRIALGGSAIDMKAMSATEVLAQHSAAKTDFESKFKAGGVAAVDAAQATNASAQSPLTALELARLNSFHAVHRAAGRKS